MASFMIGLFAIVLGTLCITGIAISVVEVVRPPVAAGASDVKELTKLARSSPKASSNSPSPSRQGSCSLWVPPSSGSASDYSPNAHSEHSCREGG